MKRILKRVLEWVIFILTGTGPIACEAVDEGICDFYGQGRNKYGK